MIVTVISETKKPGYVIRKELIEYEGCDAVEIDSAYTLGGARIGDVGMARVLCEERKIIPELVTPDSTICTIGWCNHQQQWYGWSHRAVCGFSVGSEVKRGDCGYVSDTPEGLIEDRYIFFGDISKEVAEEKRRECQILPDRSGIRILHSPTMIPIVTVDGLDSALDGGDVGEVRDITPGFSIRKCGRGEWIAESLEDARQMAIDYAAGVR